MNPELKAYFISVSRRLLIIGIIWGVYHFFLLPIILVAANHPHPILEAMRQYVLQNLGAFAAALLVFYSAFVTNLPESLPKTGQDWYSLFRAAFQSALPGRFQQPTSTHTMTATTTPTTTTVQETATIAADPTKGNK